ncbi:MAG TPA: hypothetical protein VGE74_00075, partial [Gemmata sp.]
RPADGSPPAGAHEVAAYLPPLPPEQLGDLTFLHEHGLRYPYMTGAMANGIASAEIVEAMSRAGMLGSLPARLRRVRVRHRSQRRHHQLFRRRDR